MSPSWWRRSETVTAVSSEGIFLLSPIRFGVRNIQVLEKAPHPNPLPGGEGTSRQPLGCGAIRGWLRSPSFCSEGLASRRINLKGAEQLQLFAHLAHRRD